MHACIGFGIPKLPKGRLRIQNRLKLGKPSQLLQIFPLPPPLGWEFFEGWNGIKTISQLQSWENRVKFGTPSFKILDSKL